MQTQLKTGLISEGRRRTAEQILRHCVHCGFCNTNCPTFRLSGNELDGPRGRIYQIKNLLEGTAPSKQHLLHLDRCLLCQACETHCPSGVEYGKLLDIGRTYAAASIKRSLTERIRRRLTTRILCSKKTLILMLFLARLIKPLLPKKSAQQIPPRPKKYKIAALKPRPRRIVMLEGCVEAVTAPDIRKHCMTLLDKLGIETIVLKNACCAALPYHIEDKNQARTMIKNNVDRLIPHLEAGAEAVVSTASACSHFMKSWNQIASEEIWHDKANRVAGVCKDLSEVIAAEPLDNLSVIPESVVFQCPCSLQHGQNLAQPLTDLFRRGGLALIPHKDSHLCCGSAGYYSLAQPEIAMKLRTQKLEALLENAPDVIATANIGCQLHLQAESPVPVIHWSKLFN